MKLYELFENDDENVDDDDHDLALKKTGFYGQAGAGALILAKKSKRFLLSKRSCEVQESHTWNVFGGAIDRGLTPEQAVRKEIKQECGYSGNIHLIPLYVFNHSSGFKYYNYLGIVEKEFRPRLNWESEGFQWAEWGNWPQPLHFGLAGVLNDGNSVRKIQEILSKLNENFLDNNSII